MLQELLDGTLPEKTQTDLAAHLETCASCREALDHLATEGRSYAELARNLQQKPSAPEPGLQRVLDEATGGSEVTISQSGPRADVQHELPFLAPSAKPGHLGRLGHYEILSVIGKGGFGVVLKGFDERLHRMVAIKVLSPAFAAIGSARKRFIREARAAAAVKNEHVVAIYDVQADEQPPYLVMELIDGISLQDKLDKHGALEVKEILRIGLQTAEGLSAAHKQGLVHRDIKPSNILLENGVERVKITDFGLARAVDDASVTQSGTIAGTPMYMSPEQAEGQPIDHRSDLFSLGTVLYAMCTGHPPFRASGTHAVLKRVIDAAPRPIRDVNPEIPEWLEAIIAKLHAKKPEDRFQTAREVADLLGQHLAHTQQPKPAAQPVKVVRPATRGSFRWMPEIICVALIVLFWAGDFLLQGIVFWTIAKIALAVGILLALAARFVVRDVPRQTTFYVYSGCIVTCSLMLAMFALYDWVFERVVDPVPVIDISGEWHENPPYFWGDVDLVAEGDDYRGTYTTTSNNRPGTLTLTRTGQRSFHGDRAESDRKYHGVFTLEVAPDGSSLTILWDPGGSRRVFRLTRTKEAPLPQSDLQRLQGMWIAHSAEVEGKPLPPEKVVGSLRFQGNKLSLLMPDGKVDEVSVTLRFAANPKQIDMVSLDKQKHLRGIYRFDGDRLILCVDDGNGRPTDFTTKSGSTRQLMVFKRPS
jgi:uncharacterized protein (TIGR03067 family)